MQWFETHKSHTLLYVCFNLTEISVHISGAILHDFEAGKLINDELRE